MDDIEIAKSVGAATLKEYNNTDTIQFTESELTAFREAVTKELREQVAAQQAYRKQLLELLPELKYARETHVLWRDCEQMHRDANPSIGDASFHAELVGVYDRRIALIECDDLSALSAHDAELLAKDPWHNELALMKVERDKLQARIDAADKIEPVAHVVQHDSEYRRIERLTDIGRIPAGTKLFTSPQITPEREKELLEQIEQLRGENAMLVVALESGEEIEFEGCAHQAIPLDIINESLSSTKESSASWRNGIEADALEEAANKFTMYEWTDVMRKKLRNMAAQKRNGG